MVDLIRSACLAHFVEVARSVGIEPMMMLRRAKLPVRCLSDQNMRIAVSGVRRLLEASAAAADVESFGLRMADRGGLANLGPVGLIVREQATVGAAIEVLARFIHIQDEAMHLRVEHQDDEVTITLLLRSGQQRATRQSTEMALGRLYRIIRSFFSVDWRPIGVHFVHSPPRNRRYHRYFFGCDVTFNSDFDSISCSSSDMHHPISTANPVIARYLQSRVEAIDIRSDNWSDKVGTLVRSLLPSGHCTLERVAEHLGCDRRTVHRHLLNCGTSFSAILDAQRTDLVMRLIEDSNRALAEIAELLGFSAQSAMARWFRGCFGCSITQWRNGIRAKALNSVSTREIASKGRSANKLKRPSLRGRRLARLVS